MLVSPEMEIPRILLVEDSKSQAKAARDYLEENGYEVVTAADGKAAIKAATKAATSDNVDIILLDRQLPDMSGVEVCRWLKINHATRLIPILMLTSRGEVEDRVSGLHAGADDYLSKPYSEVELNARIFALLRTKALQDELAEKNAKLEELLARVETLAVTDTLTKLYNRRYIEEHINEELKAAFRYDSPLSLLMIDIDRFKSVNDEFGHKAGDVVLREIAEIISANLREVDMAARWGGEEFVAILPRCSKEDARHSAQRILEAVSGHDFPIIPGVRVTVSIGIAGIPDPSIDDSDKLLDASDQAMYKAKKNGRNRIETV